jgi:hypothetical protein
LEIISLISNGLKSESRYFIFSSPIFNF